MPESTTALPAPPALTAPGHWYATELREEDWRVAIPDAAVDELEWASAAAGGEGARAALPATGAFLARVRARLFAGAGVVVAGRLPLARWGEERARRAVELLADRMDPPAEQTRDGVTLYAVQDRGLRPGPGVRRSVTNVAQPFHSDGPWVRRPPWVVGLHCIRAASRGGTSLCLSLRALFADLGAQSPPLLARLGRDFWWHRQGEHAAHATPVSRHPMLWRDDAGRWCARYYADYVVNGYRSAGIEMDAEAGAALAALERLSGDPRRRLEFTLREGEIEWINNRWCAHSRTAFEPSMQAERPRLLVRVWHRLDGGPRGLDA